MASPKPLIAIIGSLNIDYVTTTTRCPGPGETLTATSLSISAGGKGANQAVACGKASFASPTEQDVDVEMVGAVGKGDVYVEKLLFPTLSESGVNTRGIIESDAAQTGTASIIVESNNGQNRIMVVAGANHAEMQDSNDIQRRATQDGREPDIVVMQGEIPRSTVLSLLEHFNHTRSKTQVIFNPAPVFPEGIPRSALQDLAVLVVNEGEAIMLGKSLENDGMDMTGIEVEEDLQSMRIITHLSQQFHQLLGIKIVLITLGAKGAFFSERGDMPGRIVPGIKVEKVIDTTAAGDTFVGYFAAALARHSFRSPETRFDIANALERANRAAAKCVEQAGAMQTIPFGYELE